MITKDNLKSHIDVVFTKIDNVNFDFDVRFFDKEILLSILGEEQIAHILNMFICCYLFSKFDYKKNEESTFKKFRLQYFGFYNGLKLIYDSGKRNYIEIYNVPIEQILKTLKNK